MNLVRSTPYTFLGRPPLSQHGTVGFQKFMFQMFVQTLGL